MCGIVGVLRLDHGPPLEETVLIQMRDTLVHRGPDGKGLYLSPERNVGLAHRRLTIVDLSEAGRQPMSNEEGTIWISYNGEVYNHLELRRALENCGHRYRSKTDTETVIHLYEEYGVSSVSKLRGMYSFALWDSSQKQMLLARDRLGIKPLYYAHHNGCLLFASEIKALLAYPGFPREIDETALYHYLTFQSCPAPQTLFKGVHKLPAGTLMIQEVGKNARTQVYWDAIVPEKENSNESEDVCIEKIRTLLVESVDLRMMSDVPFGALLSGGIDSSIVVAMMAKRMERSVDTFTVGFRGHEKSMREIPYARKVAAHCKTNHREELINQESYLEILSHIVYHLDEPVADPATIPHHFASKLAYENGVKVIQVGEGSDELFCGYPAYLDILHFHNRTWRYLNMIPRILARIMYLATTGLSREFHRGFQISESFRKASCAEAFFWGLGTGFTESEKVKLLLPQFRRGISTSSSYEVIRPHIERIAREKPESGDLERMIYLELKHRLPETLLMRVDKISMASSVEARVPFLDHRLVEYAMVIPASMKTEKGQTKSILRNAAKGLIPEEIAQRPKQGFTAPVKEDLLDSLSSIMGDVFRTSALRERGYFDYNHIENLLVLHRSGRLNFSTKLWTLFVLHLWYDQWFSVSVEPPSTFGV